MGHVLWIAVVVVLAALGADGYRIINGEDAMVGSQPHQVTLQISFQGAWYHTCGGSVIAHNAVLTAAHCVDGGMPSEYRVVVNEHRLGDIDGTEQTIGIARIIMHYAYVSAMDFQAKIYPHDIAILMLADDVIDETTIIELASEDVGNFAGFDCTISGWGLNGEGEIPNVLQVVNMTVMTTEECSIYWAPYNIFQGQICIHRGLNNETGASSCSGDSGGPMVCDGVLAGVTSWGVTGCRIEGTGEFMPSVYARVSYYYDWIRTTLGMDRPGRG